MDGEVDVQSCARSSLLFRQERYRNAARIRALHFWIMGSEKFRPLCAPVQAHRPIRRNENSQNYRCRAGLLGWGSGTHGTATSSAIRDTQQCLKARVRDPEYCEPARCRPWERSAIERAGRVGIDRRPAVPPQRTYSPGFLFVDRAMAIS